MIFIFNVGAVALNCRKQEIVSLSSAEAEYVTLSETCREAILIFRVEKHFDTKLAESIKVLTDSQSAIAMTKSQKIFHHFLVEAHRHQVPLQQGHGNHSKSSQQKYHSTESNATEVIEAKHCNVQLRGSEIF